MVVTLMVLIVERKFTDRFTIKYLKKAEKCEVGSNPYIPKDSISKLMSTMQSKFEF